MITAIVLALLAGEIDVEACRTATLQCRQSVGEAILIERTIAETRGAVIDVLSEKLAARTSTVIEKLVPAPASSPAAAGHSTELVVIIAILAAVVAGGLGFALGAAGDDPQTIVVR